MRTRRARSRRPRSWNGCGSPATRRGYERSARTLLSRSGHTERRLLHAEVLRYLRRVGDEVMAFPGCPPPFAAGIAGDWERAAALWEEAGNPYEQAWELSESPDITVVLRALGMFDRLGAQRPPRR